MAGKAIPYTIGPSACPMKKLKACRENEEARADGASSVGLSSAAWALAGQRHAGGLNLDTACSA